MERNEDSGFAALTLIETSLDTSYKLVFSDSFGCFLRSLSDRVCMKSSSPNSCGAHHAAIRSQKIRWLSSVVLGKLSQTRGGTT